jgi:hypothetical protein
MSEQTTIEAPKQTTASTTTSATSVTLLSLLLLGSFFLPWINILGKPLSGWDIVRIEEFGLEARLLLAIPLTGLFTFLGALVKPSQIKPVAVLTGSLPLIGLAFYWFKIGTDLFQLLGIGAYATLFVAVLLIILGANQSKASSK